MKVTLEKAQRIMKKSNGNLDLKWMRAEKLPDDLIVYGDLDAFNCPIRKLPKNLIVCGNLNLGGTLVESLPHDLIVGGSVDLNNTPLKELPDGLIVPGYLDASYTMIETLPKNLVVGGTLHLQNTKVRKIATGMVIGDCLNLRKTFITDLPEDLTVNGRVYADKVTSKNPSRKYLSDGYYAEGRFLYANGTLTQVEYRYEEAGYMVYVGKIPGRNVVSDGTHYIHCSDVREAIEKLPAKNILEVNAIYYKDLTLDSEVSLDEAITMYGVITGANKQEMRKFVSNIKNLKEKYVIKDIILLTEGQYGSKQFARFFRK